tara:strand:- start:4733 stop:6499 length:1767 start_codon:yes stop_codon:yes gene_type:complete
MNRITFAVDFETFYSKECSIKTLGPLGYFSHALFDAYMVSVVGENGYTFVGHPKDFDWSMLENNIVLAHNASFDETLYLYGVERGWWPKVEYHKWHCTADMCACLSLPRNLKGAVGDSFDVELEKSTRDNMLNKNWHEMDDQFKEEVSEYALKDSEWCLKLWQKHSGKWTQFERDISRLNRDVVQRGMPVNVELIKQARESVSAQLFETERSIPWNGDRPLLSRKAFDEECIKNGIEPPASLAQTDVDAQDWIRRHGKKYHWVAAVTNWRRINSFKKKLASFDRATMENGRYYGGMMYYGAHTGRFSGSGGNLNLQNLPREEMFGVNMRNIIEPPKGRKLVVVDLSQIEVRTLSWLSGDHEMLDKIAKSDDIYEVFAIQFGMWSEDRGSLKDVDPKLRHIVKAGTLGSGYGSGPDKVAAMYNLELEAAEKLVSVYRDTMTKVTAFWRKLKNDMCASYDTNSELRHELPSGSTLSYGKLKMSRSTRGINYVGFPRRHGKKTATKIWHGLQAENLAQKLARDIFCFHMLEIDKAGHDIILHVHDEVVVECDESESEKVLADVIRIMSIPPDWISDIPLASEGKILDRYQK